MLIESKPIHRTSPMSLLGPTLTGWSHWLVSFTIKQAFLTTLVRRKMKFIYTILRQDLILGIITLSTMHNPEKKIEKFVS